MSISATQTWCSSSVFSSINGTTIHPSSCINHRFGSNFLYTPIVHIPQLLYRQVLLILLPESLSDRPIFISYRYSRNEVEASSSTLEKLREKYRTSCADSPSLQLYHNYLSEFLQMSLFMPLFLFMSATASPGVPGHAPSGPESLLRIKTLPPLTSSPTFPQLLKSFYYASGSQS